MKLSKPDEFDLEEPEEEREASIPETVIHPHTDEEWPIDQAVSVLLVRMDEYERAIKVLADQAGIEDPYDPTKEFE